MSFKTCSHELSNFIYLIETVFTVFYLTVLLKINLLQIQFCLIFSITFPPLLGIFKSSFSEIRP